MAGTLEGVRVISMGQVVVIPAASSVLGDWGAEVIKLESLIGEQHRGMRRAAGTETGEINYVMQLLNRNKKGLAINLKTPEGIEAVHKLIKTSDVFMFNYEYASLKEFKLDYDTVKEINPRLIHACVTGYGTKGPDKDERGYDFAAGWARSGMMHMIGEPGSMPVPQRPGMIDSMTGAHVVSAICAALYKREQTGIGEEIEVSLYHAAVWTLAMDVQAGLRGNESIPYQHDTPHNPLWNQYRTKDDRWFWMAMLQSVTNWPNFCQSIGRPELENDPKFATMEARAENNTELVRIIEEIIGSKTMEEWIPIFKKHDVIYGKVQKPIEVATDPQALANGFFGEVEHPGAGKIKLVNTPVNFRYHPRELYTSCPELGQDTEMILLELGYTWEDIAGLKEKGVIL
ncbi:CaiB/BaiF CoA transferase family protein [Chloroflexota bacterium]